MGNVVSIIGNGDRLSGRTGVDLIGLKPKIKLFFDNDPGTQKMASHLQR
jgi:hypothetical protein